LAHRLSRGRISDDHKTNNVADPRGLKIEDLMAAIKNLSVNYFFSRCQFLMVARDGERTVDFNIFLLVSLYR
jgi:hypothetical protein